MNYEELQCWNLLSGCSSVTAVCVTRILMQPGHPLGVPSSAQALCVTLAFKGN